MTLRRLELTDEICEHLARVRAALAIYEPGEESASVVELPKLEFADAILAALDSQERLAHVPRPRPAVATVPKRRRRA